MNAEESLKLARRFIELPLEKRRLFLEGVREEGIDFSLLPIPAQVMTDDRDGPSYAQRRMWFLWQLDPQSGAYNLPMAVRLHGELNRNALQQAFDSLVARHESLRTRFCQSGEEVCQQVLEPSPVAISIEDLTALPSSEREAQLKAQAEVEATAPFDLAEGPLLRIRLLQLAEQEHALLFTLHHIVADGWSLNLLIEEFLRLYDAACDGAAAELPALPIQYRDYALWQRSWLEAGEQERQLSYWRDKLGDEHTPLALPTDHPHPVRPSHRGARHTLQIDTGLAERLHGMARQHNVTLFMVLLAAFQLLLHRYSGQTAIRVGVPIANRQRAEVEGLIGCFINTQVLHTEIDPLLTGTELLQRVRETALGAQAHQELPFEQLVEALDVERSTAYSPLFQVLFNHQSNVADVGELQTRSGLTLARLEPARVTARFDLTLDTWESTGHLHAAFTYARDVFEEATIAELGRNWLQLLEGLAAQPAGTIGELPLERREPAPKPNISSTELPVAGVHQLIEQAASKYPQQLAATSGNETISYAQLNQRADELARVLLAAGVQPEQRIGVVGDRSIAMLVGILGVLKAGAAYLPLEPGQPQQRLEFMLADSEVRLVIGRSSEDVSLPSAIRLIELDQPLPPTPMDVVLPVQIAPDNLAYVIYTSGTTGTPKGVAVTHKALVNYIGGISRRLPLEKIQSMAMVTTPAADLGHTMLFGALCTGRTLHLLHKETVLDAETFAARMTDHAVDALKIVPSHLEAMLAAGRAALPRQCLILGGEACSPGLLSRIASLAPDLAVFNHYGPTETTVGALAGELGGVPLLGSPLQNVGVRVLDSCLQPAPGAARGELHITGTGLARGYLGQPALTAECFVPDPEGIPGSRMYRTGDWVRRDRDEQLLFAGRMDGQVKIRGYRVELAEIESRLRQLPDISNALVRVLGDESARQLAAYLVPTAVLEEQAQPAFLDGVRAALKRTLPEHMLPSYLLLLEHLPVTANGKVDLKALPEPVASAAAYVAPTTPLQEHLAEIWAEVLQVERVGLTDNFFALGGHSLLATQVISRARKRLGPDIPLRAVFDTADLQGFAEAAQASDRELDAEIKWVARDQPLAVSYAQHRQWLFWKLNPQSTAYNTPLAVRMQGNLDRQALQVALDALVARHESLRTVFHEENGLPWQRILPATTVPIGYEDLTGQDEQLLSRKLEEEAFTPFDLEQGPLIRTSLFKTREDEHLLAVTLHHIVSDGWSMSVMVREFAAAYNAQAAGQIQQLQPLPVQYADYAAWQRQRLEDGQMQTQLTYWKAKLEDDFEVLELPADRIRPQVQSYQGGRIDIRLPDELTANLRRLAVEANATLFHVFLAAFAILLSRYSGKDKINIGVPITNRNRLELEGLIGFFVNTVVARIGVDPVTSFAQLLDTVKETALEAQANKDIPFDVLVEELRPERGLGYNPLFQVMYNHLRDVGEQVSADSLRGLRVEEVELPERSAQFDLSLDTMEGTEGVTAFFSYASDLFEAERIEQLAQHWLNLLQVVAEQPRQSVSELPLLDEPEYQRVVYEWNRTEPAFPQEQRIHQLIEEQAEKALSAVAVVFGDQQLTYQELNQRSNQLAHKLRELGVGPDVLVGIAVERSMGMVIGLLGILKAGGAYVPLDPEYPQERLSYMMEDSGIRLLLTQSHLQEQLPIPADVQSLNIDQDGGWLEGYSTTDPANITQPENLAYVMYTSGSTGKPKGVAIDHDALATFCAVACEYSRLSCADRVLQFATVSFDGFVEQLYPALCVGAQVILRDTELWDSTALYTNIRKHGITLADLPAAYWRLMAMDAATEAPCASLRQVHVGGEALPLDGLKAWLESGMADVRLLNTYGPTEATVVATMYDCTPISLDSLPAAGVPIGNVLAGRTVHILDDGLAPTPVRVDGELFIGGTGCLARGYFKRPTLTAERFVPDPFDNSEQGGGRLYRTGDLARYRNDGVIEYAGRIDHQVKIRGFRIELGEIEAKLQEHAAICDTLVVDIDGPNGKQLAAYLVTEVESEQQAELRTAFRDHLKASLPDYMVPTHLIFLDSMPLSPNGKLDRKALPAPEDGLQQAYLAPQTELEREIATIWANVLKVEKVGLTDNFFELGGDSIISLQVVSRARQVGIQLTPKDLFQHQTVQALALVAKRSGGLVIDQGAVTGILPLVPIQQWFFEAVIPEPHHWNQSILLEPGQMLLVEPLQTALQALMLHHDALRLRFVQQQAEYQPVESGEVLWVRSVSGAEELQRLGNEAQRSLSLEQGPLLRAVLADMADGSQRLLLVIHHLVVDGVSWRVLLEDLQTAYSQLHAGQALKLPAKTSSFKAWAEHLQDYATSDVCEAELPYWQEQLHDVSDALPCDHAAGGCQRKHAAYANTRLDRELTSRLLQDAPAAYRTQINDLLLTALSRVICRWSGQAEVLIRLEGHGREELFDDLDLTRTVGWFTSMYPVKLSPQPELAASIKRIKEQLRAVPNKGIGYGLLRYLGNADTQQALSDLAQGEIVFNYLGRFDDSFDGENSLFVPAKERGGLEQSDEAPLDALLSLNGQVYEGELSLDWTFSRELFDEQTIHNLAQAYGEELKALIAHCCDERHRGVTPSDFPLAGLSQEQLDSLPVDSAQIADLYPLSPMQQGMLFHSLYEREAGDYINQMRVDVEGLDVERFRQAWQATVDNHEVLRANFITSLAIPLQAIIRHVQLPFVVEDWRDISGFESRLDERAQKELRRGFDLFGEPLLRLTLIRVSEHCHHLIFTSHHILMDGWSNSQMLGEVLQRYSGQSVPPAIGSYRDYIAWLQHQDGVVSEAFWKDQLGELAGPTRLSHALMPAAETRSGRATHSSYMDARFTDAMVEFARQLRVTTNSLVQATWLLLLQRYTGQECVAFGATVAGRPTELAGVEKQIGLFINTLPVVARSRPDQSLAEWIQQIQEQNLQLREHEHTPLYEVQRWAGWGGEDLFDTLLVFENYPVAEALQQSTPQGLVFSGLANHEQTNYPLSLGIVVDDSGLTIHYNYERSSFSDEIVQRIAGHFSNLLQAVIGNAQLPLARLSLLDEMQSQQMVAAWSQLDTAYPQDRLIHELIQHWAEKTPDAVAVTCGEQKLSYRELEQRANQMAHRLCELGVGPEARVAVALGRSLDTIVAFLAVLKAGGVYVPLDMTYPQERLLYMMEDCAAGLVLTQSDLLDRLPLPHGIQALAVDQRELWADYPLSNPQVALSAENLAYVIYTSGSTGQPKGVAVAHGQIFMHCLAIGERYEMSPNDCELQFMSLAFDGAHERWLTTLSHGAHLLLRGDELWSPDELYEVLQRCAVTVTALPPAYLQQLAEHAQLAGNPPAVRVYCFGGDAVPQAAYELAWKALRPQRIFNGYGPTETVVTPLLWSTREGDACEAAYAPIGTLVGNRCAYVLGVDLGLLPVGIAGELYLGGEGVARGYLARPALTAERFVPDPFGLEGGRMYRSGDLTRARSDGLLDYLGRIDHQVKIRGFRIELGEIESRLQGHDSVREAVVIDIDGPSGKQLVAYLVADAEPEQQADLRTSLRDHLKETLPDYMVPTYLVFLEEMPLTPNGKLDRKALPIPDVSQVQQEYVAPQSELEQQIAAIWADVLKVEKIGLHDNFFELGGHSLLVTQAVVRLQNQVGVDVTLRELFESPRLVDFSRVLANKSSQTELLQAELTKSLEALKRLTSEEIDELTS
ncbi:non-ribosomal peptide synthetase [Pseudomonas sp. FME51]|uniref:non-ribosomal peptide synthetase n=1 Tax=Pseudomonas sp. FME51 TaxID=2742609 RepID=UPI001869261B|nr:non-ribosomal peptide synthetase [Pseudomonas sp. FME51]